MHISLLTGNYLVTKILFWIAVVICIADVLASVFTLIYQRYWYPKILRPRYKPDYAPSCAVIIPCKGIVENLKDNLLSFLALDYPDYQVIYAVESENDPALPAIRSIVAEHAKAKVVIAGHAVSCAQKNHNLLAAVDAAPHAEVFAFADADIGPTKEWLINMVLPLSSKHVAVSSGFRWITSTRGTWGELTHCYINIFMYICFSCASFIGSVGLWGGSMAIRKKDFFELGVKQRWSETGVDDMSLSQIIMKHHRNSVLVPDCITHTDDPLPTFSQSNAWFTRQIMFLKAYQKPIWLFEALPVALIAVFFMTWMPIAFILHIVCGTSFWGIGGGIPLVFYAGEFAGILLFPLLGPVPAFGKLLVLSPLMRFGHAFSYAKTFFTNSIFWSGTTYKLSFFSGKVISLTRDKDT